MPDIDMDFADDRRDEVIQYVIDRYGRERVAQIITFGTPAGARRDPRRAGAPSTIRSTKSTASPSSSLPSRSA